MKPEAVFGLHVWSALNAGKIGYRSGPFMAASDRFRIVVKGEQTHGSRPWGGVDPIVASAQIVMGLQTIVSRQIDISAHPAVVSVGAIKGGIRNNIIPDQVEMIGTFRTFDPAVRQQIIDGITRTSKDIAASSGATAEVEIGGGREPGHRQRREADRAHAAVARARRGTGQCRRDPVRHGRRGLRVLRPARAEPVLLRRHHAAGTGRGKGAEPTTRRSSSSTRAALELGLRAMLGVAVDYLQGANR